MPHCRSTHCLAPRLLLRRVFPQPVTRFALFHPSKHSLLGTPACFAHAFPALAPQFTLFLKFQGFANIPGLRGEAALALLLSIQHNRIRGASNHKWRRSRACLDGKSRHPRRTNKQVHVSVISHRLRCRGIGIYFLQSTQCPVGDMRFDGRASRDSPGDVNDCCR